MENSGLTPLQSLEKGATHYNLLRSGEFVQDYFKQDERGLWYLWSNFQCWSYMVNLNDKKGAPEGILPIETLINSKS